MKICLINNLLEPLGRGGAEKITKLIGDGLKTKFYITTKPNLQPIKHKDNSDEIYYLSSLYFYLGKIPKFFRFFWHICNIFGIINYFKTWRILAKEKPDVVIMNNLMGVSFLIPRLVKRMGIKSVCILHDLQLLHPSGIMIYGDEKKFESLYAKVYTLICRFLFKDIDIVISPSKWLLQEYEKRGFFPKSTRRVVKNPCKDIEIIKKNSKQRLVSGKIRFLYIGKIEYHKGILFLVKTFKKINKNKFPDIELVIVGAGSKQKELKAIIDNDKKIRMAGRLSGNELQREIKQSDCVIVPSICYENSPTVIYEAFTFGIPVIASKHGGVKELLDDSSLLFEPNNEEELINRIEYFIKNRKFIIDSLSSTVGGLNILDKKKYALELIKLLA